MDNYIKQLEKLSKEYLALAKEDTRRWALRGLCITTLLALFIFIDSHEVAWSWEQYLGIVLLVASGWVMGKELDKKRIKDLEYKGMCGLALSEIHIKTKLLRFDCGDES